MASNTMAGRFFARSLINAVNVDNSKSQSILVSHQLTDFFDVVHQVRKSGIVTCLTAVVVPVITSLPRFKCTKSQSARSKGKCRGLKLVKVTPRIRPNLSFSGTVFQGPDRCITLRSRPANALGSQTLVLPPGASYF